MNYQITITRKEPNENFAEQLQEWQDRERFHYGKGPGEYPNTHITTNALICELTEEQFKAVKAEVLKAFQ